jgi:hypothetical protein
MVWYGVFLNLAPSDFEMYNLNKLAGKGSLVTKKIVNTAMQCYQRRTQNYSGKCQI